jgi:hypothetical protein
MGLIFQKISIRRLERSIQEGGRPIDLGRPRPDALEEPSYSKYATGPGRHKGNECGRPDHDDRRYPRDTPRYVFVII